MVIFFPLRFLAFKDSADTFVAKERVKVLCCSELDGPNVSGRMWRRLIVAWHLLTNRLVRAAVNRDMLRSVQKKMRRIGTVIGTPRGVFCSFKAFNNRGCTVGNLPNLLSLLECVDDTKMYFLDLKAPGSLSVQPLWILSLPVMVVERLLKVAYATGINASFCLS